MVSFTAKNVAGMEAPLPDDIDEGLTGELPPEFEEVAVATGP